MEFLVSIIIPAHNMEPWIGETLNSVLSQTFKNWECIVVDDGSRDGTAAYVKSIADERVKLVKKVKGGVSSARNLGLKEAKGNFVAFLDADDLWHPTALEKLLAPLIENEDYVFSWANFARFEDGTGRWLRLPGTQLQRTGNLWFDLLIDNFLSFGSFCVSSSVAKQHTFNEKMVICEDRDWLLRVIKGQKTVRISDTVHYYRQRSGSSMRDLNRFVQDLVIMLDHHLNDPDIPKKIKTRARSALNFHLAVLFAKSPGQKAKAFSAYLRAVMLDPLYLENYLRPVRKIWFSLPFTQIYLDIPSVCLASRTANKPYNSNKEKGQEI